ncbi:MAG: tRNA (adenosine(37)-N6)-threonylcarbamoyltransferase complex dimerization subunit type 1 TsaB [Bacteroidetes bacterium]|nr:tRNA (adenosine(37)-N6)-threonylcarbamoyltransferase complex dimerization subunit type 1 TsaB [Bacteroidota bacterium]
MNESGPILSIETSESICGACVYFDDKKYFEAITHLKNSHAEKLFETIDYVIRTSEIEIDQFKAIAVSAGPGSFTGLRIGMSAAKGIAFGSSLPIIPVPTFEAFALQLAGLYKDGTEFIIANKVNLEEIYYAKFQIKANNYIFADRLRIVDLPEFHRLSQNLIIFGNVSLENIDDKKELKNNIAAPSPVFVAKWGKLFGNDLITFNYDFLEPNYLKNFIIKERKND